MTQSRDGYGEHKLLASRPGPDGELDLHRHGAETHEHTLGKSRHRHEGGGRALPKVTGGMPVTVVA